MRQLRRDRRAGRRQGLKILARKVNNNAARTVPKSQPEWLWDCTTPRTAPTGITVPGGALRFSPDRVSRKRDGSPGFPRRSTAPESFFFQTRRSGAEQVWPSGRHGRSPQRLKSLLKNSVRRSVRVELAFRPASKAIVSGSPSWLQPATDVAQKVFRQTVKPALRKMISARLKACLFKDVSANNAASSNAPSVGNNATSYNAPSHNATTSNHFNVRRQLSPFHVRMFAQPSR